MSLSTEVSLDGIRYGLLTAGDGPPLLLLHGFTGSVHTWDQLIARLATHRRVIAVDLLGHGTTTPVRDPVRCTMVRQVADLTALIEGLVPADAPLDLLGYSMGGRVALHLALARPERIRALMLESASPGIADPMERAARLRSDQELATFLEREGLPAFVDRWEKLPLWTSQAGLPEDVRARLREQRLRNDAAGLACSLRGMGAGAQQPLHDRLAELTMPALLITGEHDARYRAIAADMAAHMPRAAVAVVPGAGHAVHLEQPDAFEALVREFL